jgi:hypothetical protein
MGASDLGWFGSVSADVVLLPRHLGIVAETLAVAQPFAASARGSNNETDGTKKDPRRGGRGYWYEQTTRGKGRLFGQTSRHKANPFQKKNPAEAGLGARGASLRPKGL